MNECNKLKQRCKEERSKIPPQQCVADKVAAKGGSVCEVSIYFVCLG